MNELRIFRDVLVPDNDWYLCQVVAGPFKDCQEAVNAREQLFKAFDELIDNLKKRLND